MSTQAKKLHIGLLPRIIIGMLLGVGAGYIAPEWCARLMATVNSFISQYLGFLIPFIILGFVVPAIADVGRGAGKMLLVTAGLAYVATIFAGLFSYFFGSLTFPSLLTETLPMSALEHEGVKPWFVLKIDPVCSVTTSLVLAFVLGLVMARRDTPVMHRLAHEFRDVLQSVIRGSIIPILPIYVFGIFLIITVEGQVMVILKAFLSIVAIIFGLHVALLVIQYLIAGAIWGHNPFKMLRTMLPAYFTALGTQSSAATIPVTLRQTILMGVREDIAGFTVPLCATIHLSGSTLKIVACALALMIMQGMPHDFHLFMGFVAVLGVTMVAAPGTPGGAIMAALGVLTSVLGFTEQQCGLMIALYIAMDSFGTACNVTGDGAIAAIVDRIFRNKKIANTQDAGTD